MVHRTIASYKEKHTTVICTILQNGTCAVRKNSTNNTYVIWLGSRRPNENCTVTTYNLLLLQILIDISLLCFPIQYEKESKTFYIPSQIWSFIT